MNQNVVIRLLNALNQKELKKLKKFLASPFFNTRADVCFLFELYLTSPSFFSPPLDKLALFNKVYPEETFDDAKIRHLLSYLSKLVKQFYMQLNYQSDRIKQHLDLLEQLKLKGLNKSFEHEWTKTDQFLQKQDYRNSNFYYQQHILQGQKAEELFKLKRQGEMSDFQIAKNLQLFFVARILRQSCSILTYQKMSDKSEGFELLDEVLSMVERFNLTEIPVIAIYNSSVLTLKYPEQEENYQQLIKLLQQHWHIFPTNELRDIHLLAINYCIKKLNHGNQGYIREAFELYRSGLKKEVLFESGLLSPFTYKNILKLGLELKEFDWIDQYLDQYKKHLNPSDSNNHYTYCRAVFYFNTKKYSEVLKLLQKVSFKDKLYELDSRRMLLIIYYEGQAYNSLESLLKSFKTYIHRQKDLGYHKENYINLLFFVNKFLKENLQNKETRKKLINEINKTKALAGRRWLLGLLE